MFFLHHPFISCLAARRPADGEADGMLIRCLTSVVLCPVFPSRSAPPHGPIHHRLGGNARRGDTWEGCGFTPVLASTSSPPAPALQGALVLRSYFRNAFALWEREPGCTAGITRRPTATLAPVHAERALSLRSRDGGFPLLSGKAIISVIGPSSSNENLQELRRLAVAAAAPWTADTPG